MWGWVVGGLIFVSVDWMVYLSIFVDVFVEVCWDICFFLLGVLWLYCVVILFVIIMFVRIGFEICVFK